MNDIKQDENRELTPTEVKDILRDIEIEASDEEYVESLNEKSNLQVRFRRPPKTMTEILETLKEADKRYSHGLEFLAGGKQNIQLVRSEDDRQKRKTKSKRSMLENIPPGITISRLEYPVYVNGKRSMSNVILLGVKQRAVIHASFVNGKSLISASFDRLPGGTEA